MALDEKGNLYGTTVGGGAYNNGKSCYGIGCGVVFKLTPKGKELVLHRFCPHGNGNCTDGAIPLGGLALDNKGNLYGTTVGGGAHGQGVLFRLTP